MRRPSSALSSLTLAALAMVTGCGGQIILAAPDSGAVPVTSVTGTSEDAGTDGAPGTSNGQPFPECPGTQPQAGYTCTTPNQGCAYVNVQTGACVSWTCDSTGHWVSSTPAGC
ncbi:MAG: hypothetical protein ACLQVI_41825 [Polyangiaceae bacterium]